LLWDAIRGLLAVVHSSINIRTVTTIHFTICRIHEASITETDLVADLEHAFMSGYIPCRTIAAWKRLVTASTQRTILGFKSAMIGGETVYFDSFAFRHDELANRLRMQFCVDTKVHEHPIMLRQIKDKAVQTCRLFPL
jgi:hypothetical protein